MDTAHAKGYDPRVPWFTLASNRLPSGAKTARLPFVKHEHRDRARDVYRRTQNGPPGINDPQAMVSGERFLAFAKAYINVLIIYRDLRSAPKRLVTALVLVEWALRQLNGRNDPALIRHETFARADQALLSGSESASVKYEVGLELSILAGMLQGGYHSKTFRFGSHGFGLLERRFSFSSSATQPPGRREVQLTKEVQEKIQGKRLPNEIVRAIGLAYRMAHATFGGGHEATAMASLAALPFTTVSMRLSDLLELREDAVDSQDGRTRITIYRPKNDFYQELPVPKKLAALAQELIQCAAAYSASARDAFKYYIENFDNFSAIDRLFIPPELRDAFNQTFFNRPAPGITRGMNEDEGHSSQEIAEGLPLWKTVSSTVLSGLQASRGVDTPNDVFPPPQQTWASRHSYLSLADVRAVLQNLSVGMPQEIHALDEKVFVELEHLCRTVSAGEEQLLGIELAYRAAGRRLSWFSSTEELKERLLASFKSMKFPHWPYTSRDKKLRLDEALCVCFENSIDKRGNVLSKLPAWWRPNRFPATRLLRWIDHCGGKPPQLFLALDIKLTNGQYPAFTLHGVRAYLQTRALTLGVGEPYLDLLAGRVSGPQSAHYDLRTPAEIVSTSIEGFDPDVDSGFAGPVATAAARIPNVVDRKIFLFARGAPKQVTEVGGCSTSWHIDPCEQHGDCMRCGQHVWRKGDEKRRPIIQAMHQHSCRMIVEGYRKLQEGHLRGPIERHIRQHESVRSRCEQIFAIEADDSIAVGTVITFEAAPEAIGLSELTSKLRNEQIQSGEPVEGGSTDGNA